MQDEQEMQDQLLEIVENQIESGEPKKVKETLMRLMMTGNSREDSIAMMGCAVAIEVFDVVNNGATFNEKRYAEHLERLPDLGFMEGE
ncbi:hypothetical protein [Vibrio ezurae]|uniref:Uncharacterized protein n=1 Tax=Vibrio ezurae NBRC 102218 TaxID=1219080 RepID=U3B1K4_9VIBR|nr:hypothetical protein [Vibrio ezurae]GAD79317.1 hypothetical protein VEZ01S_09_00860 [Vibrio ezurae NBRC 102218]